MKEVGFYFKGNGELWRGLEGFFWLFCGEWIRRVEFGGRSEFRNLVFVCI